MNDGLKKTEETELQERMAHIGRLSAGIGHNIMTPLSLIMMNADLLTMKLKGDEGYASHLEEIIHQASLISKIAETMMWKVKTEEQTTPAQIQFGSFVQQNLDFWMGDMFFKHKLDKDFRINPHTPSIAGIPFHFTSFIDEWILSIIQRAEPRNGGSLSVMADVDGENNRLFLQFEDNLPLPPEAHMKALENGGGDPRLKEFYPALARLLEQTSAMLEVSPLPGEGLKLRLTWSLD